jgi:hypothetical protein
MTPSTYPVFWGGYFVCPASLPYVPAKRPDVYVVDPQLQLHRNHARLPHVYPGNSLCLYSFDEWHPGLYIANTIVPWVSLWLFFLRNLDAHRELERRRYASALATASRQGRARPVKEGGSRLS